MTSITPNKKYKMLQVILMCDVMHDCGKVQHFTLFCTGAKQSVLQDFPNTHFLHTSSVILSIVATTPWVCPIRLVHRVVLPSGWYIGLSFHKLVHRVYLSGWYTGLSFCQVYTLIWKWWSSLYSWLSVVMLEQATFLLPPQLLKETTIISCYDRWRIIMPV